MLDLAGRRFKHSSSRRSICKLPSNQFSCFVERISRLFQFAYTDAFVVILTTQIVWVSKCFRCSTFLTRKSQCVLVSQFDFLDGPTGCYGRGWLNPHAMAGSPLGATNLPPCHIRLLRQSHAVIPIPRLFPQNLPWHQSVPGQTYPFYLKLHFWQKRITAILSSPANLLGNAREGRKEDEKQAESNQGRRSRKAIKGSGAHSPLNLILPQMLEQDLSVWAQLWNRGVYESPNNLVSIHF